MQQPAFGDAETGSEILVLHKWSVDAASFSPDGKYLITGSPAFSSDTKRILTVSEDHTARLWDWQSLRTIAVLEGHSEEVWVGAFAPDNERIVTGSADNTIRIWDAKTAKQIAILAQYSGSVRALSFSPDGKLMAASDDRVVHVLDVATGNEITRLRGHTGAVHAVSFSPDGRRLATASWDNTVRLWDAETGKEIALKAYDAGVRAAAWRGDGRRLLTAGEDKVARVWDTSWLTVYGSRLRDRVCSEKLVGADEFTEEELGDPIFGGYDPSDSVARNPCLHIGPLSLEYWSRMLRIAR
jgi:WD40 repeat protein